MELIKEDIGKYKCSYGCGNDALYYFANADKYCCSNHFSKCPKTKELFVARNKSRIPNSKIGKIRTAIANGTAKCCYCGEPAKYIVSGPRPGCCQSIRECPSYHKVIGDNMRKMYAINPAIKFRKRQAIADVQKRPDVKAKKRKAMKMLHNNDCIPCVEFQENYIKGRAHFKETIYKRDYTTLVNYGCPIHHIPLDVEIRRELVNYIRYKLSNIPKRRYQ